MYITPLLHLSYSFYFFLSLLLFMSVTGLVGNRQWWRLCGSSPLIKAVLMGSFLTIAVLKWTTLIKHVRLKWASCQNDNPVVITYLHCRWFPFDLPSTITVWRFPVICSSIYRWICAMTFPVICSLIPHPYMMVDWSLLWYSLSSVLSFYIPIWW